MTGKLPPTQAITEAQKWAGTQDLMVFALEPLGMFPFHFVISEQGCISLVCVRHPKYPDFNTWYIEYSCRTIIAQLRALPICCEGINREIWVRRTAQTWYRYLVLPKSLKFLEKSNDHEKNDRPDGGAEPPPTPPDHSHQAI